MRRVLEVRDLAIGHDGEVLLDELAFEVDRGQVFAILGASGCGKSTLLRPLVGLQPPLAGRVYFTGIGPPPAAMMPPRFGVVFQSAALFGSLTLLENVLLPLQKWT
ncbi:MAG TPA: ATP-binding cassette domain-containing protein, partial [bacterium]|nr:ATP-binding cassette domain-containing protein [bacterium]